MRCSCPARAKIDSKNPQWFECKHLATAGDNKVTSWEKKEGKGGEVWDAEFEEAGVKRPIALKIIGMQGESEDQLRSEIYHLVSIKQRDNKILIPMIFGWGRLEGEPKHMWLAMERIEGKDLSTHRASEDAESVAESLDLVCSLLETLATIHSQGAAHGDLRSCNLMKANDSGKLYVIDFGDAESYDAKKPRDLQYVARVACQFLSRRAASTHRVLVPDYSPRDVYLGVAPAIQRVLAKGCRGEYARAEHMLAEFREAIRGGTAFTADPENDWRERLTRWYRQDMLPVSAYSLAVTAGAAGQRDRPGWWREVRSLARDAAWFTDDAAGAASFATKLAQVLRGASRSSEMPPTARSS